MPYKSWYLWLPLIVVMASPLAAAGREAPLIEAVKVGDTAAIDALLRERVDVNQPALDGATALHWAAYREDVGTVERLIRAGANVKTTNRHGVSPLALASLKGNGAIISLLLKAGVDPNSALPAGETALMTAARTGRPEAVAVLLAHGADVNAKEEMRDQTALMWAAAEGHSGTVHQLIRAGADVHVRSRLAPPPPDRLGRPTQVGAQVSAVFGGGAAGVKAGAAEATPPKTAAEPAEAADPAAERAALEKEPEPEREGLTAFLFAVRGDQTGAAMALLEGGADVNETMNGGMSALNVAIVNGNYGLAMQLLQKGADPNAAAQGWTALHQAIVARRPSLFRPTPFPVPDVEVSDMELIAALIEHGADVNALTVKAPRDGVRSKGKKIGATPFFLATKGADVEAMRFLISKGADPMEPNVEGTTPLMVAAGVGLWRIGESPGTNAEALEALKYVYELGGSVDTIDENGETAVHGATHRGSPEIIQFLAAKGANLDLANKIGWTPLTIAGGIYYPNLYEHYPEAYDMLKQLGATNLGKRRPIDIQPQQRDGAGATPE